MRPIDADSTKEHMCDRCEFFDLCAYRFGIVCNRQAVINAQPTVPAIVWHPYPDEIPPRDGRYLVTVAYVSGSKIVMSLYYQASHDYPWLIAWAEMPEPYRGESDGR